MTARREKRESEFYWFVPQPGASVSGEFTCNGRSYTLEDASGYHDHNYWQLGSGRGLFIDEVIGLWIWGRCVAGPYTMVFMETWMGRESIKSLMLAENERILFDTGEDISIRVEEESTHPRLKTNYPSRFTLGCDKADLPFRLSISCRELVEAKDLLSGVNPFIAKLIRNLVARPAYYGILATVTLEISAQSYTGSGIYESMQFRQ
jgi:hypothetical protein